MLLFFSNYLGNKYQTQDSRCSDQETQAEEYSIQIHVSFQRVKGDHNDCSDDARNIDSSRNTLGVVESLHFDLAYREGKYESNNL